jgi:hypothetical protein
MALADRITEAGGANPGDHWPLNPWTGSTPVPRDLAKDETRSPVRVEMGRAL